jgi:hypothetical protein
VLSVVVENDARIPLQSKQTRLDQTRPDRTRPDRTRPDRTRPDQTGPDETRPDRTRPDQTRLDQTGPDQTRPDQTGPDQTVPDHTRQGQTRLLAYLQSCILRLLDYLEDGISNFLRNVGNYFPPGTSYARIFYFVYSCL